MYKKIEFNLIFIYSLKPEETKTNSVMNKKKVPINATKSKAKLEFNKTLTIELGRVGDEIAKMLSESEHMNVDIPTPSLGTLLLNN